MIHFLPVEGRQSASDGQSDVLQRPLFPYQSLQRFDRSRPITLQQTRQRSIGQQFTIRLACGTIIGFIADIADALNRCLAHRTGFSVSAMNSHIITEGCHFFRETISGLFQQDRFPFFQNFTCVSMQYSDLLRSHFLCQQHRRKPGSVQNFIGISITDAAEQPGIC